MIMKGLTGIGFFVLLVVSAEYCAAEDQSASQLEKLLVRLLGKYKTHVFCVEFLQKCDPQTLIYSVY